MAEMTPGEFFKRFGTPDTWKPMNAIGCGPSGCRRVDNDPQIKSVGRYLKAKGEGEFSGTYDEWRTFVSQRAESED